ncbi:MAG TPA: bifunctional diaminohydroxyphosphoribosylaminopyrimidine deaminase/5-amino-6-(5-phosphoribosylamino)uracil reductase RibD [Lacipirellulaceae bacterium]
MTIVTRDADAERFMARALELAARGEGVVEPNPMVGCVLVRDGQIVGDGWHQEFGGPHAEINAIKAAGKATQGATAYVTLEPCCHQGKTPPCTQALKLVGVKRVAAAMEDPFPSVDGGGIDELRKAGIECEIGVLADRARELNAPYLKRLTTGRPWVIAKWAQSLDGKMSTPVGESKWISNERSREIVQQLRGRVDAIIVGSGTARADDPMLTARPLKPADVKRKATRVVVDSLATISLESQLVKTAREVPVLVAVSAAADVEKCKELVAAGVDIFPCAGKSHAARFESLLDELGRRKMTNVLVEGGAQLLRTVFDAQLVDEAHIFIAPRVIGGDTLPSPVGEMNADDILEALGVVDAAITDLDGNIYIQGRLTRRQ